MTKSRKCLVSFISTFFTTSTRGKNDEANSKREMVIEQIGNPPTEFMEDELLGANWKYVKAEWDKAIQIVATKTNVTEPYTSYRIEKKGGRKFNYDGVVMFYNEGGEVIASRKIEFKYGATNVNSVPQFLSLTTKKYQHMFREETSTAAPTTSTAAPTTQSYEVFWYHEYLDKYIACDPQLQQSQPPSPPPPQKPSLEEYIRCIQKTNYDVNPFFEHLKKCEDNFKKEKAAIVNKSISEYLSLFGSKIDLSVFTQKIRESQTDKTFILWGKNMKDMKCHIDTISPEEMEDIQFRSIKNKNTIVLESSVTKTTYNLLLRWRNHKGILNPAWQISMKRLRR